MFSPPKAREISVPGRSQVAAYCHRTNPRLEHALQMRAVNGRRKVAIIPDADRLNPRRQMLSSRRSKNAERLFAPSAECVARGAADTIVFALYHDSTRARSPTAIKARTRELVKLLQHASGERSWSVQFCLRPCPGHSSVCSVRCGGREARNRRSFEAGTKRATRCTDGAWLEEREEYYKALQKVFTCNDAPI